MMYNGDNQRGALARRQQEGVARPRGSDWFRQRDPWQEMQEMQRQVDQLFSRVFGQSWPTFGPPMGQMMGQAAETGAIEPDIDFSENESGYTIKAALPGISPDDIQVEATEDSIRLTAQSRSSSQPQQMQGGKSSAGSPAESSRAGGQGAQGQTMQHRQSQFSRVSRFESAYSLPDEIKPNEVNALFRHGILELNLPKARPNASQNRTVSIPIQRDEAPGRISGGTASMQGAPAKTQNNQASGGAEHQPGGRTGDGSNDGQANRAKTNTAAAGPKAK